MPKVKLFSVTIKDCAVECIASTGGAGGQNKNRRHTAVRITHAPSGAVGYSADERDQRRNKEMAFGRMARSSAFQSWVRRTAAELLSGTTVDERVEEAMSGHNLKVEVRDHDRWIELAAETAAYGESDE